MFLIRQRSRTEVDNNQHSKMPLMQVEKREAEWLMVSRTHTRLHSRGQSTRVGDQCWPMRVTRRKRILQRTNPVARGQHEALESRKSAGDQTTAAPVGLPTPIEAGRTMVA